MPTYSYACKNCHHQFDIHQSFTDNALTDCPECGGPLRKVFNSVGVVFKGSGFYRTDSRDKNTSSTSSSTSSDGSSSTASSSDSSTSGAQSTQKPAPTEKADKSPKADKPKKAKPAE